MTRCVAYQVELDGKAVELAYDTAEIAEINVSTGVLSEAHILVPAESREAAITIRFKPGAQPLWTEVAPS